MADLHPVADVHHHDDDLDIEKVQLDEKTGGIETLSRNDPHSPIEEEVHGVHPGDPFPIDPLAPHEEHTLTVRAIIVGILLGSVVGASNIYLGLKTGFTFGPQLFGAIFGFAALKPLAKIIGGRGPGWLTGGKEFGPKENVTVQTAATSAGGIGIIFVSAVPAMYRLGLLSDLPSQDVGKLIALTVCTAYYGVFFVIPLRKYYILKQKLTFPTPTATAYTIRSLHAVGGHVAAAKKAWMLTYSFIGAFLWKVASGYAPGIILDWHIGWTMYRLGWTSLIHLENYGWWIEFTPSFIGAGMLSGMNASWSFFGGAVLAWGIIAPSVIHTGAAVGVPASDDYPLISYQSLKLKNIELYAHNPSPRYWLLWPGVLIMLVYSFVEVMLSSRNSFLQMGRSLSGGLGSSWRNFKGRNDPNYIRETEEDNDPAAPEDRVPFWAWTGGLLASVILTCALCATQFPINVGEVILALVLGFLFSFIACQSAGDTDINPVSTVAKASQLIFGGVGKGRPLANAEMLNLVAGTLAAGSAAQASDMTGDLKTGHLIGARPKDQFVAQLAGATVAIFLNVGLFILFTKSAPCILYPPETGICSYGAPSVSAWAAVSAAVTAKHLPIPKSSGFTAIGLSIVATITVAVKHFYIPRKYWHYIPNWNAIGLAFVVPQVYYPIAMIIGATGNYFWERRSPATFDMYGFALAAGLVAGEGIGGVMNAILAVAGVDGGHYGTSIGCPGFEFCG